MISKSLYDKYNIPAPRYTSYPTVPYWEEHRWTAEDYLLRLKNTFDTHYEDGISIYIHLPYCESLCTFCACNKRITKQHSVEKPYIDALKAEWDIYINTLGKQPIIKELHLGGGTPTFFSPDHLEELIKHILKDCTINDTYEFSFEGHPNNTTREHLECLSRLGFKRVSFGIQDYDNKVQHAIHRVQSFDQVLQVTNWAREIGYTSISHDLIFGLPFQKVSSIEDSILKTNTIKPERIAFYSYAHVPWIKGVGQRGFSDEDLPNGEEKRILYETGKRLLEENGYYEIAMDHFALEKDALYQSFVDGTIHRNFMGYTSQHTQVMLSLGVSSISDCWTAFAQNEKNVERYLEMINDGILPIVSGHIMTDEDVLVRKIILDVMCTMHADFSLLSSAIKKAILERLLPLQEDGLIILQNETLKVTKIGKVFLRNIALAFDLRYFERTPNGKIFSMSI